MKAFITGSHAYGAPNEDSDIDIVVFMSKETLESLKGLDFKKETGRLVETSLPKDVEIELPKGWVCHKFVDDYAGPESSPLRFDKLNLICVTSMEAYTAWKEGTEDLIKKKPVTRDQAIEHMKKMREKYKVGVK